mmetsp:Transcript_130883/g.419737  ORF Transcript_130883/g.419737 Transcript_130883/m.419737 type:complete len:328 (-) Transcript_130883:275-1258(-)
MHTTQVLHFAPLRRPQSLPAEVQSDDFAGMSRARSCRCSVDPTVGPEPTTMPALTWLICCLRLGEGEDDQEVHAVAQVGRACASRPECDDGSDDYDRVDKGVALPGAQPLHRKTDASVLESLASTPTASLPRLLRFAACAWRPTKEAMPLVPRQRSINLGGLLCFHSGDGNLIDIIDRLAPQQPTWQQPLLAVNRSPASHDVPGGAPGHDDAHGMHRQRSASFVNIDDLICFPVGHSIDIDELIALDAMINEQTMHGISTSQQCSPQQTSPIWGCSIAPSGAGHRIAATMAGTTCEFSPASTSKAGSRLHEILHAHTSTRTSAQAPA